MTEVNVNLVLDKYSANFQIYQGICLKYSFFVIYHKVLCKHLYVNLINQRRFGPILTHPQSHIWGNDVIRLAISALSFPFAAQKPNSKKAAAFAAVFLKFVESHKASFPLPAPTPAAACQYPGQQPAPQRTRQ